ncbi:hypothetical protein Ancab_032106 [Ancistrocladus abbreviatus]
MEQAQYWLWTKRKHDRLADVGVPVASSCVDDSWEEQAFAEDAAGLLGGCVWPPRSYACSFCRREFRSAQALGGHMNVHRKDRARLKQLPSQNEIPHQQKQQVYEKPTHNYPLFSNASVKYLPQDHSTFVYHSSPNSQPRVTSSSPSTFYARSRGGSSPLQAMTPPCYPTLQDKRSMPPFSSLSCSLSSNPNKGEKDSRMIELECQDKGDQGRSSDLSISFSLVVQRSQSKTCAYSQETNSYKRRKVYASAVDCRDGAASAVQDVDSSSLVELDLELRLGDGPKV